MSDSWDSLRPQPPTRLLRCAACKHWTDTDEWNEITHPRDPDTYQEMEMSFTVKRCTNPNLLFCERPLESNGFAVADGSTYFAAFFTAEDFGCVQWEALDA